MFYELHIAVILICRTNPSSIDESVDFSILHAAIYDTPGPGLE